MTLKIERTPNRRLLTADDPDDCAMIAISKLEDGRWACHLSSRINGTRGMGSRHHRVEYRDDLGEAILAFDAMLESESVNGLVEVGDEPWTLEMERSNMKALLEHGQKMRDAAEAFDADWLAGAA